MMNAPLRSVTYNRDTMISRFNRFDSSPRCGVERFDRHHRPAMVTSASKAALSARFGAFVRPYVGWSMARELRTLKRLVEDPAALVEALRGGDPRKIAVDPSVEVWGPTSHRPPKRGWLARQRGRAAR